MPLKLNPKHTKFKRKYLRNKATDAEKHLWRYLRKRQLNGHRFTRQFSVGNYILDFYCPNKRLAIEIDGGQHNDDINKKYDQKREKELTHQNIKIIRFWNNQVLDETDSVLESILHELEK